MPDAAVGTRDMAAGDRGHPALVDLKVHGGRQKIRKKEKNEMVSINKCYVEN